MSAIAMPLTPETLARHELIGLRGRVVEATNPSLVGIEGHVIRETMRTVVIADEPDEPADAGDGTDADTSDRRGEHRVRQVPKRGSTFEFAIPADRSTADSASGNGDPTYVTVRGDRLVARPARRTETTGDSPWR